MDGIYYVIKNKTDGTTKSPKGVSKAPHLYSTKGKAEGALKRGWRIDHYEVVPVHLTELREGVLQ